VFPSVLIESISWLSSVTMAWRSLASFVSLAPWMTRSRARWIESPISPRAVSATFCHEFASCTFDWYCLFAARSARSFSAWLAPYGSSDGWFSL
jgi:hypothetical protein